MRTRVIAGLICITAVAVAAYRDDLAAIYAAIGVYAIFYVLHAIEFKLNKLLNHHGVSVPDYEIARD